MALNNIQNIDLLLLWNWEHDAGFIRILGDTFCERGLSFLAAAKPDLSELTKKFCMVRSS